MTERDVPSYDFETALTEIEHIADRYRLRALSDDTVVTFFPDVPASLEQREKSKEQVNVFRSKLIQSAPLVMRPGLSSERIQGFYTEDDEGIFEAVAEIDSKLRQSGDHYRGTPGYLLRIGLFDRIRSAFFEFDYREDDSIQFTFARPEKATSYIMTREHFDFMTTAEAVVLQGYLGKTEAKFR